MESRRQMDHRSGIRTVPGTPVHGTANNRAAVSRTPSSGGGRTPAVTPGTPAAGRPYPGSSSGTPVPPYPGSSRISLNSNHNSNHSGTPSPHTGIGKQLWTAIYEYQAQGEDELK